MLSLTLKEGDYLIIGDNIRLQYTQELTASSIRIGIDAPRNVNIVRGKAYEAGLSANYEENADKLKEIEAQKQDYTIERKNLKEKARKKALEKKQKKLAEMVG